MKYKRRFVDDNFIENKEKEIYLFKIVNKVIGWLGIEIIEKKDNRVAGIGQVTKQEVSDLVMTELINIK